MSTIAHSSAQLTNIFADVTAGIINLSTISPEAAQAGCLVKLIMLGMPAGELVCRVSTQSLGAKASPLIITPVARLLAFVVNCRSQGRMLAINLLTGDPLVSQCNSEQEHFAQTGEMVIGVHTLLSQREADSRRAIRDLGKAVEAKAPEQLEALDAALSNPIRRFNTAAVSFTMVHGTDAECHEIANLLCGCA